MERNDLFAVVGGCCCWPRAAVPTGEAGPPRLLVTKQPYWVRSEGTFKALPLALAYKAAQSRDQSNDSSTRNLNN